MSLTACSTSQTGLGSTGKWENSRVRGDACRPRRPLPVHTVVRLRDFRVRGSGGYVSDRLTIVAAPSASRQWARNVGLVGVASWPNSHLDPLASFWKACKIYSIRMWRQQDSYWCKKSTLFRLNTVLVPALRSDTMTTYCVCMHRTQQSAKRKAQELSGRVG